MEIVRAGRPRKNGAPGQPPHTSSCTHAGLNKPHPHLTQHREKCDAHELELLVHACAHCTCTSIALAARTKFIHPHSHADGTL